MHSVLTTLLLSCSVLFLPGEKSKISISVSDYNGRATDARIEFYQGKKMIFRGDVVNGEYSRSLEKGKYTLRLIKCDTTEVNVKVWNKEHEYQLAVDTSCED